MDCVCDAEEAEAEERWRMQRVIEQIKTEASNCFILKVTEGNYDPCAFIGIMASFRVFSVERE